MSKLKVETFLFEQDGIDQERKDHFIKIIDNAEKLYTENILLTPEIQEKVFSQKFKFIWIRSDIDFKIRISGVAEFLTDFIILTYKIAQTFRLIYSNPGAGETATIKFIGIKE